MSPDEGPGARPEEASRPADALVVGCGLIGTSVGLALRRAGWSVLLWDRSPAAVALAEELGAGTGVPPGVGFAVAAGHPVSATEGPGGGRPVARLAVLAAPPSAVPRLLETLQRLDLALSYVDVSSAQAEVQREAEAIGADLSSHVGSHPLAGRERSGAAAAREDLFDGCLWALVPPAQASPQSRAAAREMVLAAGGHPVELSGAAHDDAVALASHLPQLLASALAALLGAPGSDAEAARRLAGQGLRDMVRIAGSDPALWADITVANREAVRNAVSRFRTELDGLVAMLAPSVPAAEASAYVAELVARGNRGHDALPGKHGGPRRGWETLQVVVPDTPGQLGRLFSAAAAAAVNVEDVAIEHGHGRPLGVVELSVAAGDRDRLAAALRNAGWSVHR